MVVVQSRPLTIGSWQAPDFSLQGTDGKTYTLKDFSNAKGLVPFFTCNHCPFAKAAWPAMIDLSTEYKSRRIAFIAINPNAPSHPDDSFERMQEEVEARGIPFPYLVDDTQKTASDYQAQCTPDVYLFDADMKLYYYGRIDDRRPGEEREPEETNLKDAIESLLRGDAPPNLQPPAMGCSIKWL